MKKATLLAFTLLFCTTFLLSNDPKDDIMLQSFGWDEYDQPKIKAAGNFYKFIASKASEMKAAGFDMVWMPPPSKSTGGVGYLPTELHNFNSTWGSDTDLRAANAALKAQGIFSIADVVANHRNGTTRWSDFTNPTWTCLTITSTDEVNTAWTEARGPRPCGGTDTGDDFDGGRDLDHRQNETREGIKTFLTKLKEQGFDGWRWDMTKGFSASYINEYNTASAPYFSVGEFWDGNANTLKNWVDGTGKKSATFDFSQYYAMQSGLSGNFASFGTGSTMAGLAGVFGYSDYAVTFVDNHDTFVKFGAPEGVNIMKAYAYILTHPGIPCVFGPHYYGGTYSKENITKTYPSYKDRIDPIMAARKANGIDAWSTINVATTTGCYAATIKRRFEDAEPVLAVKIGPASWTPSGSGWNLVASGTDYAVWSKATIVVPPTFSIGTGNYPHGQSLTLSSPADQTIHFTTDGSTPTASSPLYTSPIALPIGTTTVRAISAKNGVLSPVITNTYNIQVRASTIKLRFKAPANWTSCNVYVWEGASTHLAGVWPGTPTIRESDGFYSYTVSNHTQFSINVVFNNASTPMEQTVDLSTTGDICWQATGSNKYSAEVVSCPATNIASINVPTIQVYPNPVADVLTFVSQLEPASVRIFDNMGRLVAAQHNANTTMKVNNLKSGIYNLIFESVDGQTTSLKFIKK